MEQELRNRLQEESELIEEQKKELLQSISNQVARAPKVLVKTPPPKIVIVVKNGAWNHGFEQHAIHRKLHRNQG